MLRWLHLSDLHVGKDDQAQEVALNSIASAIEEFSGKKPFDVVLLTGDLAFSGKTAEYGRLVDLLVDPLRKSSLGRNAKFVAVPGNHDLDCDCVLPTPWSGLDRDRQDRFFHLTDESRQLRQPRSSGFSAYSAFLQSNNILGADPTREPASLVLLGEVSFLTVVTAFFSDKKVSDREQTPAPLHAIRYLIQKAGTSGGPLFILGHHPSYWFTRDTRDKFKSLLGADNALYLHGHEHRVCTEYGPKGLLTLGFGAAYQSPSEISPRRGYTNSFAVCEFDDALHLKIVSWDADGGRWRLEPDLPMGFESPSNRIADGFTFALPTTKQSALFALRARSIFQSRHLVSGCLWLAEDERKAWQHVLNLLGLFSPTDRTVAGSNPLPPGHLQFRVVDADGTHLVHAISAHGDVIHEQTVHQLNTLFDTSAPASCLILTLGDISEDARTLLSNLSNRKAIDFRDRDQIADALVTNLPTNVLSDIRSLSTSLRHRRRTFTEPPRAAG